MTHKILHQCLGCPIVRVAQLTQTDLPLMFARYAPGKSPLQTDSLPHQPEYTILKIIRAHTDVAERTTESRRLYALRPTMLHGLLNCRCTSRRPRTHSSAREGSTGIARALSILNDRSLKNAAMVSRTFRLTL